MRCSRGNSSEAGFTLIEAMASVAVMAAIVATIAYSFRPMAAPLATRPRRIAARRFAQSRHRAHRRGRRRRRVCKARTATPRSRCSTARRRRSPSCAPRSDRARERAWKSCGSRRSRRPRPRDRARAKAFRAFGGHNARGVCRSRRFGQGPVPRFVRLCGRRQNLDGRVERKQAAAQRRAPNRARWPGRTPARGLDRLRPPGDRAPARRVEDPPRSATVDATRPRRTRFNGHDPIARQARPLGRARR